MKTGVRNTEKFELILARSAFFPTYKQWRL